MTPRPGARDPTAGSGSERVLRFLEEHGLLLLTDSRFPSLATLVAGGPVRGSWWGHPKGHAIWRAAHDLSSRRDVFSCKLVSGKVTFLHRRLWPALFAVASAGDPWQRKGLSRAARSLLLYVRRSGELRTDRLPGKGGRRSIHPGDAARELEARLLVNAEEIHTESGAHAKRLETWDRWARRAGVPLGAVSAGEGRRELEAIVERLNRIHGSQARLPWQDSE